MDGRLPSVKALDEEFQELLQEKKELYAEYKPAKERMQELLMAKQNVERFLNLQEMRDYFAVIAPEPLLRENHQYSY